jgi:TonB-dependent siderophore receptor
MNVRFISLAAALLAAFLFLSPSASWAVEQTNADSSTAAKSGYPDDLPVYSLEEVVVTGQRAILPEDNTIGAKMLVPIHNTPASVGIVTRGLIETQDAVILGDALKNVSGVNAQTGFGVFDYFVIRGFDSFSSGLVLTDGAYEPEASFHNLYNVQRVEVLKGPGTFLYGGNPLSGTVNLVRKQPLFQNVTRVSSSYGHFQTYRAMLDANVANPEAGVAFRTNALIQGSDHFRDGRENKVLAVNPAFTYRMGNRATLITNVEYIDNRFTSDAGLPIIGGAVADVPRSRSYQSPFDTSDQEIFRARVDYNARLESGTLLRAKLYATKFDWVSKGTLFNGVFPNAGGSLDLIRTLPVLDDRQTLVGGQFEAIRTFHTGAVSHKMLTGIEASRLTDDFTLDIALLPSMDVFNPVETAVEPLFFLPDQSMAGDTRSLTFAPYLVDHIHFHDQCQIFLGGRFDVINYKDTATATDRSYRRVSPMFGFVYAPTPTLTLYSNSGMAFAPPSSRVVGDQQPEESYQFEVGTKKKLADDRVDFKLAAYYLRKDNVAILSETGLTSQEGDARSRGLEIEFAANPVPGWVATASYAYTDSRLLRFTDQVAVPTQQGIQYQVVDRSGNRPSFAPEHILNLWTSIDLPSGIGLGLGVRYVGAQFIAEDNSYEIDSVITLDAAVSLKTRFARWRLGLRNLTNQRYETRGFGSSSVIPAHPINVHGSINLTL